MLNTDLGIVNTAIGKKQNILTFSRKAIQVSETVPANSMVTRNISNYLDAGYSFVGIAGWTTNSHNAVIYEIYIGGTGLHYGIRNLHTSAVSVSGYVWIAQVK